jgi:protein-tyrosine phosphatase
MRAEMGFWGRRPGLAFALLSLASAAAGLATDAGSLVFWWCALSYGLVAAGYLGLGARVLGKRADGRLGLHWKVLHLPYALYTWSVWAWNRRHAPQPFCQEIVPGLLVGRRLPAGDYPPRAATVLDLTSEFSESTPGHVYVCLPILDDSVPTLTDTLTLLERLRQTPSPLYVHCAEGRGRSAMMAAILVLERGLEREAEAAISRVKHAHPGARLSPEQAAFVARFAHARSSRAGQPHLPSAAPARAEET